MCAFKCLLFRLLTFGVCLFAYLFAWQRVKSIATICVYIFLEYLLVFSFSFFRLRFFYFVAGCIFAIFPAHFAATDTDRNTKCPSAQSWTKTATSFGFSWLRLSLLPFGKLKCASREPKAKTRFVAKLHVQHGNCNCISSNLAMHEIQFKAVFGYTLYT